MCATLERCTGNSNKPADGAGSSKTRGVSKHEHSRSQSGCHGARKTKIVGRGIKQLHGQAQAADGACASKAPDSRPHDTPRADRFQHKRGAATLHDQEHRRQHHDSRTAWPGAGRQRRRIPRPLRYDLHIRSRMEGSCRPGVSQWSRHGVHRSDLQGSGIHLHRRRQARPDHPQRDRPRRPGRHHPRLRHRMGERRDDAHHRTVARQQAQEAPGQVQQTRREALQL